MKAATILAHLRKPALISLMLSAPLSIRAQDWAKAKLAESPRHGEFVTLHEPGGRNLQAWVVYPEVKEKAPVVVMIHEIFGMSDWAREMADEVAGAGYIVVEPDLLSGFGPPPSAAAAGGHGAPLTAEQMNAILHRPQPPLPATLVSASYTTEARDGSKVTYVLTGEELRQLAALAHQPWSTPGMGCDPMACAPGQKPLLERVAFAEQPQQPSMPMDHMHMQQPGANTGAAYVPLMPGGTAAFPDQTSVTRAVSSLDPAGVTADLDAAADYGKHLPSANGKLYVAGFCWGGGKSFLFATHRHDLSAAFVFYGPPPPADLMKNINGPVYGFYAGNDARITASVPQTVTDMKAAGKTYDPVTYDGAGHGFMRAGEAPDASPANSAARQAGFRRLIDKLGGLR